VDSPKPRARSLSLEPPKRRRRIAKIMRSSVEPIFLSIKYLIDNRAWKMGLQVYFWAFYQVK